MDRIIVKKPITRISFTPNFFAINNPPPIVRIHARHIVYDRIYRYILQSLEQNETMFIISFLQEYRRSG